MKHHLDGEDDIRPGRNDQRIGPLLVFLPDQCRHPRHNPERGRCTPISVHCRCSPSQRCGFSLAKREKIQFTEVQVRAPAVVCICWLRIRQVTYRPDLWSSRVTGVGSGVVEVPHAVTPGPGTNKNDGRVMRPISAECIVANTSSASFSGCGIGSVTRCGPTRRCGDIVHHIVRNSSDDKRLCRSWL